MATSHQVHGGMQATAFEALKAKLWGFMQAEIYPNEQLFAAQSKAIGEASHDWHWPPILIELKRKASAAGTRVRPQLASWACAGDRVAAGLALLSTLQRRTHAARALGVLRHTHGMHPVAFQAQAQAQGPWLSRP